MVPLEVVAKNYKHYICICNYGALFASLLQLIFLYGLCRFCMAMLYILCGVCPFSGQTNNFKWSLLLFYMAFSFRMVFSNFVWQLKFLMTFWIAYDLFHSVWRLEFHVVFIIPYGVSNFIWSLSFRMVWCISAWYDALRLLSFGGEKLKLGGSAILKIPVKPHDVA